MSMKAKNINIGVIGLGTVATGVIQGLQKNGALIAGRTGCEFTVKTVIVRDASVARDIDTSSFTYSEDIEVLLNDKSIEVVVELMGGIDLARDYVLRALNSGKAVVTANKALICEHGPELFEAARANGTALYYEASVAGGIPIIKVINEGLAANDIQCIYAILNGTCNFILTQMKDGMNFDDAVKLAQDKGYAEADPSLDVDGIDAAHKASILASLVYGKWMRAETATIKGLRDMDRDDMVLAARHGYTIKLMATIKKNDEGLVHVDVSPTLVPEMSPVGTTSDVYNAIQVYGDVIGDTMFYGQGAGRDATASAVLADLINACRDLKHGCIAEHSGFIPYEGCKGLLDPGKAVSRFYLRIELDPAPMALAKVSAAIGSENIAISDVVQKNQRRGQSHLVAFFTEECERSAIDSAIQKINDLGVCGNKIIIYRVEDIH